MKVVIVDINTMTLIVCELGMIVFFVIFYKVETSKLENGLFNY